MCDPVILRQLYFSQKGSRKPGYFGGMCTERLRFLGRRIIRAIMMRKDKSASGASQAIMRCIIVGRNLGAVSTFDLWFCSPVASFTGVLNVDPVRVVRCRN